MGLVVVLASCSLWFGLPQRLLHKLSDFAAISVTLLGFICISIPSDLLGGYFLPRRHLRTQIGLRTFLAAWLRGVLSQALILGLCAMLLLKAGRWGGNGAAIGCFTLLMLVLIAAQSPVARLVANLPVTVQSHLVDEPRGQTSASSQLPHVLFRSSDQGFVGGWVGFPRAERLIVPDHWQRDLVPDLLAAELTRRRGAIATGARTRGLLIALLWNVLGFSLACFLPGSSPGTAPGLVQAALWFTLWSFAGLLTLPSLNRPAVLELDRFALKQGVSRETLAATISRLDSFQDDEPQRGRWIERIFHPIPSVESRIAVLHEADSRVGGWQCARTTLYLSWACFGFLARAVHCNAGRPALWVLFPGD